MLEHGYVTFGRNTIGTLRRLTSSLGREFVVSAAVSGEPRITQSHIQLPHQKGRNVPQRDGRSGGDGYYPNNPSNDRLVIVYRIMSSKSVSNQKLAYEALVDRVADWIRDEHTERASDEHRRRLRIALHHNHLPKLEEVGIINYETETGQVEFVGGELAQDLLTLVGEHGASE